MFVQGKKMRWVVVTIRLVILTHATADDYFWDSPRDRVLATLSTSHSDLDVEENEVQVLEGRRLQQKISPTDLDRRLIAVQMDLMRTEKRISSLNLERQKFSLILAGHEKETNSQLGAHAEQQKRHDWLVGKLQNLQKTREGLTNEISELLDQLPAQIAPNEEDTRSQEEERISNGPTVSKAEVDSREEDKGREQHVRLRQDTGNDRSGTEGLNLRTFLKQLRKAAENSSTEQTKNEVEDDVPKDKVEDDVAYPDEVLKNAAAFDEQGNKIDLRTALIEHENSEQDLAAGDDVIAVEEFSTRSTGSAGYHTIQKGASGVVKRINEKGRAFIKWPGIEKLQPLWRSKWGLVEVVEQELTREEEITSEQAAWLDYEGQRQTYSEDGSSLRTDVSKYFIVGLLSAIASSTVNCRRRFSSSAAEPLLTS